MTNVRAGGAASFLPPTAFAATDERGHPLPNVLTLTPPHPDASGAYDPGASREGWVALALPSTRTAGMIRFLPYRTDPDPRYLSWDRFRPPARRSRIRLLRPVAARIWTRRTGRMRDRQTPVGRAAGVDQTMYGASTSRAR